MKKPITLLATGLLLMLSNGYAQSTASPDEKETAPQPVSNAPGNTKFVLTGAAWADFYYDKDQEVKYNFNSYGFAPVFLWKLSDKLFFEGEMEIADGEFELEFAKLSYSLNKYMTIGAGRMLRPFGAFGERWEPAFVQRFPNTHLKGDDSYIPGENHLDWGAMLGIDIRGGIPLGSSKMNYALYVSNGPSLDNTTGMVDYENLNDNNSNKGVGGRIGFLPLSNSSLEIGFSGETGIAGNQEDSVYVMNGEYKDYSKVKATAMAVDFNYTKAISSIKSIIGIRGQFNSLSVDKADYAMDDSTFYPSFDNTFKNYFVQLSFRPGMSDNAFLKNIELLFRYSSLEAPADAPWGPKDKNGKGGAVTRTDIGLNYWLSWRTGIRLAYESTMLPDDEKSNQLLVRFVMGF